MSILNFSSCYLAVESGVIKTALLNTVIGMGIVFVVLIMISLLISLFKFIPMLFGGNKKKVEEVVVPVAATTEVKEEELSENLVDDTELVAVITAAIMASMGEEAPADGLVVRSIRRTNRKKFA